MNHKSSLMAALNGDIWAIEPNWMRHFLGSLPSICDMKEKAEDEKPQTRTVQIASKTQNQIAVLPIRGPITQKVTWMTYWYGGTSTERFGEEFDAALNASNVGAIVLDVDSPGGTVSGVPELAAKIRTARGKKPIIAVANTWAASAAYWLASQADELVMTPSGEVGSIGVWSMHVDYSGYQEQEGVKTTLISSGKYKGEANPYEPLGDEARAAMQDSVNRYYGMFVSDVASGRGTSAAVVRNGYGEGRMIGSDRAESMGMVNRGETLDAEITRLGGRLSDRQRALDAAAGRRKMLERLERES